MQQNVCKGHAVALIWHIVLALTPRLFVASSCISVVTERTFYSRSCVLLVFWGGLETQAEAGQARNTHMLVLVDVE